MQSCDGIKHHESRSDQSVSYYENKLHVYLMCFRKSGYFSYLSLFFFFFTKPEYICICFLSDDSNKLPLCNAYLNVLCLMFSSNVRKTTSMVAELIQMFIYNHVYNIHSIKSVIREILICKTLKSIQFAKFIYSLGLISFIIIQYTFILRFQAYSSIF